MPFAYHGTCYQTQGEAIAAFTGSYPLQEQNHVFYLSSVVADGAAGVKFSLKDETNVAVVTDGVVQFGSCDLSTSGFSALPVQSVLFVLALFFAAFLGFRTSYK